MKQQRINSDAYAVKKKKRKEESVTVCALRRRYRSTTTTTYRCHARNHPPPPLGSRPFCIIVNSLHGWTSLGRLRPRYAHNQLRFKAYNEKKKKKKKKKKKRKGCNAASAQNNCTIRGLVGHFPTSAAQ